MRELARVTVVGGGVIGLSTAVVLADAGYRVSVVAERAPGQTTSAVAAAFWEPFHVEGVGVAALAERTHAHFVSLWPVAGSGIRIQPLHRLFGDAEERVRWEADNPWHDTMRVALNYRPMPKEEVVAGFSEGVLYDVPVVHMPTYLGYLQAQLPQPIERRLVMRLSDELKDVDVLVNCTGLGSKTITDVMDDKLIAVRGQILIAPPTSGVRDVTFVTTGREYSDHHPFYAVDRPPYDAVLGGTYIPQDGDDATPDEAVTLQILQRCAKICPSMRRLRPNEVVAKVGLRPFREKVRLELDTTTYARPVVHCYGHGGGGVSLSWGSALRVRELIEMLNPTGVATA